MILKFLGVFTVFVAVAALYFPDEFNEFIKIMFRDLYSKEDNVEEYVFSAEELMKYNGVECDLLYLSIMGNVYDVTSGKRFYGPNEEYNMFVGRDASKAFLTLNADNGVSALDDILNLSHKELLDLLAWKSTYDKKYIYKGKLKGLLYNSNGKETPYMKIVQEKIEEAEAMKAKQEQDDKVMPACNIKWEQSTGTNVWCTTKSGGVERDWEGFPRMLYSAGETDSRCVCIKSAAMMTTNANLKEYKGCSPTARSCFFNTPEDFM